MSIVNSLGSVFQNKEAFKKYETDKEIVDKKRKALAEKTPPTTQELEKAKRQGKVIMDVIDKMDAHSEDVAETTETATMVPQSLLPLGVLGASGFIGSKILPKIEKAYATNDIKFFNGKEELINSWKKTLKDKTGQYYWLENTNYIKKLIRENKDTNDDEIKNVLKQAKEVLEEHKSLDFVKKYKKQCGLLVTIPLALTAATFVASTVWATKLQVGSSRVARWQSREQMKDPKYFVQFTDEEIAQATKIVEEKEKEKDGKKTFLKNFKKKNQGSLIEVIKDKKKYDNWKKTSTNEIKKVETNLSGKSLEEAKKDKEVIQRITKQINNTAEDYSENMEVVAETLIGGTPFLGAAIGGITSFVINKLGIMDKYADKTMKNFLNSVVDTDKAGIEKAYNAIKNTKKVGLIKNIKNFGEFLGETMESTLKENDTGVSAVIKKAKAFLVSVPKTRNILIGAGGAIITGIAGAYIGMKMQKASARAGRYAAKREIEKDPTNFIGRTDEELNSVNVEEPKKRGKFAKFINYLSFTPRVFKQYFDYEKHRKTDLVKENAIKDELVKLDVSKERLDEAKDLQRKLFNTFEKVDDKSQEYSESVEAAAEIAKPLILIGGIASFLTPIAIIANKAAKGKISVGSIASTLTSIGAKLPKFGKKKSVLTKLEQDLPEIMKRYSGDKERTFDRLSRKIKLDKYISGGKDLIENSANSVLKNIVNSADGDDISFEKFGIDISNFNSKSIYEFLENYPKDKKISLKALGIDVSNFDSEAFKNLFAKHFDIKDLNVDISKFSPEALEEIINKRILQNKIPDLSKYGIKLPKEELDKIMNEFSAAVQEFKDEYLSGVNLKEFNFEEAKKLLANIGYEKEIKNVENKINEIFNGSPEITQKLKNYISGKKIDLEKLYKDANAGDKGAGQALKKLSSTIVKSPEYIFQNMKAYIKTLSEEDFNKYIENLSQKNSKVKFMLKGLKKEHVIKIINNVEKITEKLPAQEAAKLTKTCFRLFKDDPLGFINIFTDEHLTEMILNKTIKIGGGAGIAWGAANLGASFLIESYIANLQKQAGKLGVMKALEELDDPKYYANSEHQVNQTNTNTSTKAKEVTLNSKYLIK